MIRISDVIRQTLFSPLLWSVSSLRFKEFQELDIKNRVCTPFFSFDGWWKYGKRVIF